MSFAANKFPRNQRRILQESSKLNRPASKKNDVLKTTTDGIIPAKPECTHRDMGEQSNISQQGSLSIASLSSTETILKRSLKNVPRPALPVRQTLTSKLRQQKANPLLQVTASTPGPLCASTPHQQRRPAGAVVTQSTVRPPRLSCLSRPPASAPARRLQKENRLPLAAPSRAMPPPPPPLSKAGKVVPPQAPRQPPTKPKAPAAGNSSGKPSTYSSWKEPKKTAFAVTKPAVQLRANTTPKKPAATAAAVTPQPKSILRRRSKSADNVNTVDGSCDNAKNGLSVASKSMNKSLKSVVFYSPLHAAFPSPKITNTPPPSVLRKRLEDWLKKRGKNNYSYHHLCCFGLNTNMYTNLKPDEESPLDETITLEESSPNVDAPIVEEVDQLLCAPQGSSTPEKPQVENEEKEATDSKIAHPGALHDLQQLIHSGYPRDQCEQWLALIVRSRPAVKEEFLYWECLAALEEARGDFGGAVDCLGRAIEQGADAAAVDARLDVLWERFCALGSAPPTPSSAGRTPTTTRRRRAVHDPKHIFKSTVIRFALQRKTSAGKRRRSGGGGGTGAAAAAAVEDNGGDSGGQRRKRYVVTPVRRSSRRSSSVFRSSEGLQCFASLRDLSPSVQEDMSFQGNALLDPNT